jgi:plexin A
VLVGVFAPSDGPTSRPRRSSAVCAYRLSYIDRLFDENIHMCFNGSLQYRGLPYISGKGM